MCVSLGHVLVLLCCYHRLGWLINSRNLFLTVLEVEVPRSGCQCGWGSALLVCRCLGSPGGEKAGDLSGSPFVSLTYLTHEGPTPMI